MLCGKKEKGRVQLVARAAWMDADVSSFRAHERGLKAGEGNKEYAVISGNASLLGIDCV